MDNISLERYEELIRAEQVAKQLKSFINMKYHKYATIDREDIKVLYQLYCEGDENERVS